mmetsp:Transcript_7548/g.10729  ORF Transcript_7548/g.10729 Transcript_7548/m.10729 type:complete len:481 (-) Transcript_7548:538-1980(-)
MTKTPPRNNYAAPHTPIASAKRPRSSGAAANSNNDNGNSSGKTKIMSLSSTTATPSSTPKTPTTTIPSTSPMSPMHPPRPVTRDDVETISEEVTDESSPSNSSNASSSSSSNSSWVGRKVDALFSPVLSFLNAGSSEEGEEQAAAATAGQGQTGATAGNATATTSTPHTIKEEEVAAITEDEDVDMTNSNQMDIEREEEDEDDEQQPQQQAAANAAATAPSNQTHAATTAQLEHHNHQEVEKEVEEVEEEDDPYGSLQEEPSSSFEEEEFNPYLFIKSLPPYAHVRHMSPPIALPEKTSSHKITLVLDLDETLVHCTVEKVNDADLVFPVVFHGAEYQVHVRLRPYLFEFLESVSKKFEVVVFTASQQVYADKLLDRIDPEKKYIQHRMFRESCLAVEGNYLKDLNVCGRDLTKTVLVDNSPHAFGYQVDNGIPIESWFDDAHDSELMKLDAFLKTLHGEPDVRKIVRERFQTYKLIDQY